jgi:two-component system chemotaxis response regulator CheB
MDNPLLRALVVDDSALYRKFVRTVLEDFPEVEVVGTAANGRIGLNKIETLKPDLVTLDLEMPELDGLGLLRELSARGSDVATIMISSHTADGAKTTNTALQLGAFDFVLKPTGRKPEDSRTLLKADLDPKIRACISVLKRKRARTQSIRPARSADNAVRRMAEKVNGFRPKTKILGIGISTGGPVALNRLLPRLPGNFPCPILIVQHMPPLFTKSLANDLNKICALEVKEAENGMIAEPGQVLIAPGGAHMGVVKVDRKPTIYITDDPPERNCKPAVDFLFRSIAEDYGNSAVGAILTGMGDDGTEGCKLMKKAGAMIIAQDEASCVVYGMPRSVFEAGLTDQVVPLDDMPASLLEAVGQGVGV